MNKPTNKLRRNSQFHSTVSLHVYFLIILGPGSWSCSPYPQFCLHQPTLYPTNGTQSTHCWVLNVYLPPSITSKTVVFSLLLNSISDVLWLSLNAAIMCLVIFLITLLGKISILNFLLTYLWIEVDCVLIATRKDFSWIKISEWL